jgi:hypothetical protein
MRAGWIAKEFEMSKSTLSYHVDIFKQSDLVRCERQVMDTGKRLCVGARTSLRGAVVHCGRRRRGS